MLIQSNLFCPPKIIDNGSNSYFFRKIDVSKKLPCAHDAGGSSNTYYFKKIVVPKKNCLEHTMQTMFKTLSILSKLLCKTILSWASCTGDGSETMKIALRVKNYWIFRRRQVLYFQIENNCNYNDSHQMFYTLILENTIF